MTWLITGGAGYIGSHVVRQLDNVGIKTVVFDDLSGGRRDRVPADVCLEQGAITDTGALVNAMTRHGVTGVVNLAARKSVPESVDHALWYYQENVSGFLCLLDAMSQAGVSRLVHSSSAAIYGCAEGTALTEDLVVTPVSPYAETKLVAERALRDIAPTMGLSYLALRYFNPVGAAAPELAEVGGTNVLTVLFSAIDSGETFEVTGSDFDTRDGSGLRDYIHILDLAEAHVAAVQRVEQGMCGEIVNVGTGRGYTVLVLLDVVRAITGRPVPHRVGPRRPGDPAGAAASVDKAVDVLGWRSTRDLKDMVASAWNMWRAQHDS